MFRSAEQFKKLLTTYRCGPLTELEALAAKDWEQFLPRLSVTRSSFNPALQFEDEDAFVQYILSEQPEAPKYFAVMKRVNKEGPRIIGNDQGIRKLDVNELPAALTSGTVIDCRDSEQFAKRPRTSID